MTKETKISLFDIAECLSASMDLVSTALTDHHKRVAYISLCIGKEFGLSVKEQNDLLLAGILHDSGSLSSKERLEILEYEIESPKHADLGYLLLRDFEYFSSIAHLVRYHHTIWDDGRGSEVKNVEVNIGSHILHLSDRISVLIDKKVNVLSQAKEIRRKIKEKSGKIFVPKLVEIFEDLSNKEYFWLDIVSPSIKEILKHKAGTMTVELNLHSLLNLSKVFSRIIDFRSRFTSVHSVGVSIIASTLAEYMGFSPKECLTMKIAGYFHDLGKLAVPNEILEKPAKLTSEEFNIMKAHTFHSYRILENIEGLDTINEWGAFHHEKLDGSGYPFHHKADDISLGARIMAVADVFTAITEDRPYRKGMLKDEALNVMEKLAEESKLDKNVVSTLIKHYDEVNSIRESAQSLASKEYQDAMKSIYL